MRIIGKARNSTTLSVDREELRAIICSLGESLEVIEHRVFETQMGVTMEEVSRLVDEIDVVYRRRGRRSLSATKNS